jgi:hypothetical protein
VLTAALKCMQARKDVNAKTLFRKKVNRRTDPPNTIKEGLLLAF